MWLQSRVGGSGGTYEIRAAPHADPGPGQEQQLLVITPRAPNPMEDESAASEVSRWADRAADWSSRLFGAAAVVLLPLVVLGIVGAITVAGFEQGEVDPDSDPLSNLLSSRAVIIPARIVAVFLALYVVVSVVALIYRGQWIVKAGPVQASEAVRTIDREKDHLHSELKTAKEDAAKWEANYDRLVGEQEVLKRESDELAEQLSEQLARIEDALRTVE